MDNYSDSNEDKFLFTLRENVILSNTYKSIMHVWKYSPTVLRYAQHTSLGVLYFKVTRSC
jgi:hypothetical protein